MESWHPSGGEKKGMVALRVSSLKTLFWYLLGVKRIPCHANKTGSWYLRGSFQNFTRAPLSFSNGSQGKGSDFILQNTPNKPCSPTSFIRFPIAAGWRKSRTLNCNVWIDFSEGNSEKRLNKPLPLHRQTVRHTQTDVTLCRENSKSCR